MVNVKKKLNKNPSESKNCKKPQKTSKKSQKYIDIALRSGFIVYVEAEKDLDEQPENSRKRFEFRSSAFFAFVGFSAACRLQFGCTGIDSVLHVLSVLDRRTKAETLEKSVKIGFFEA